MPVFYESSTINWSSDPKGGKTHGTRNIVKIKNGKGTKIKQSLNNRGKVIQTKKQKLKKSEIDKIINGQFIPKLWSNCQLPICKSKKFRKTIKKRK